jgi:RND family efflux transporter MFP subunit
MSYSSTFSGPALVLGFCLGLMGCTRAPSEAPATKPTPVTVSHPVERDVTDYTDFTGRTAAVDSVEVRARVSGHLDKVNFKEGALVKKDDVLFEIDPRTYQAALAYAKAEVERLIAQHDLDVIEVRRTEKLLRRNAETRENLDKAAAQSSGSKAGLAAVEAQVQRAELDLGFTKVTAPVSGRVSRYNVTVGNLVQSGEQNGGTLLTTIVSVDPMYAYFDVDERTAQRVGQLLRGGKIASAGEWPVALGLASEEEFPHQGTINFVDNQVNPKTGTLRVRGVFPNKDAALSPGFFARVRVPVGQSHQALLVSDRALDTDQGQKILYVVNNMNEVVSRPIRVGALHDGLRAIEHGLKPGERVIVNALQLVRPGITVEPKLVDMPTSGGRRQESGVRSRKWPVRVAKTTP